MVLHERHLGHEIGRGDEFRLSLAARHNDVKPTSTCVQCGHDSVHVEITIAERDIDFVEDHKHERRVTHEFERLLPSPLCGSNVAHQILRFPCKTFAHCVPE